MNYYERHLGDYAKDTAHLTMIEHGAYGLLLDRYYATEHGIPEDQAHRVARARTKEEKQAVDAVLVEFFILVDGIWINGRAEEEMTKAQTKIKAAKENGKRGGRPKTNQKQTQEKPSGLSVGSGNETQSKAHQTPDTRHQYESFESVHHSTGIGQNQNPQNATWEGGNSPPDHETPSMQAAPTRTGSLCRSLRALGVDAAPGRMAADDWQTILARRTDEEIIGFAENLIAKSPAAKRITLAYMAPGLLEDPTPVQNRPRARDSPPEDNSLVARVRRANPLPGDAPEGSFSGNIYDIGGVR